MLRQSFSPLRSLYAQGPFRTIVRQQFIARQNSTVANVTAKATAIATSAKGLVDVSIYWSKVIAELSKQVYLKEGFAPPTVAQFQTTFKNLYAKSLPYLLSPEAVIASIKSINLNSSFKFNAYFIQVIGAFSLGEIIGRRKVVGY
ncbi:mitochondrial ATP synthase g subunit-domain-containing protein [Lipomyces japonicus]|uniref:mitochondrial ATP synthase g subunit-domain-containing protein n=1 Tax=Lipomyces japonicus TaxID=56871 RepID=UPI0034CDB9C9